jgi:uncharacterized protein with PIN domain
MNSELFMKKMETHNLSSINDKDLREMISYCSSTLKHLKKENNKRKDKAYRTNDENMYYCECCDKKYDYYYRDQHLKSNKHIKRSNKLVLE